MFRSAYRKEMCAIDREFPDPVVDDSEDDPAYVVVEPLTKKRKFLNRLNKGAQHRAGKALSVDGQPSFDKVAKWAHWFGRIWDEIQGHRALSDIYLLEDEEVPLADTQVLVNARVRGAWRPFSHKTPYLLLQEFLDGDVLTEQMLIDDAELAKQLAEALKSSFRLYEEFGRAVDFVGFEIAKCIVRSCYDKDVEWNISNMRVDEEGQIKLLDSRLLDPDCAIICSGWYVRLLVELQHEALVRVLSESHPELAELKPPTSRVAQTLMRFGFWHKETMPKILEPMEPVRRWMIETGNAFVFP